MFFFLSGGKQAKAKQRNNKPWLNQKGHSFLTPGKSGKSSIHWNLASPHTQFFWKPGDSFYRDPCQFKLYKSGRKNAGEQAIEHICSNPALVGFNEIVSQKDTCNACGLVLKTYNDWRWNIICHGTHECK